MAAQEALQLDGGVCYSTPPPKPKRAYTFRAEIHHRYQAPLPLAVPEFDATLRSRQPETRGRQINRHGYDRWVKPTHDLAAHYYEMFTAYRSQQGGQRRPHKAYIDAIDCLFTNFIRNRHDGYWVRIPRNRSKRQKSGIGIDKLRELVDWLAAIGHIEHRPGWAGAIGEKGSGVMSTARPVSGLLRELRSMGGDCVGTRQTRPVIELRGADGKRVTEELWTRDNNELKPREAMARLLAQLNKQWTQVIVTLDREPFEQVYFRSVFTRSFHLGGRIYESNIQNIPGRDRQRLKFDGQAVTECDYSGCQWRLQYALEGLEFPENDDPYRLDGFSRDAVKAAAQPIGYGRSIAAATTALKRKQNPAMKGVTDRDGQEVFDARLVEVNIDALVAAFLDRHQPIAHRFCTPDYALRMQREDALLMADILRCAIKSKVLAYPIHDSVIVPTQHRQWLLLTMRDCFHKRYGFDIPVAVKY